ncbi:MAG: 30S ribosomal protein S7 [Candidatus Blackburnbacteria bacterium RIFCSPHIGHO2_01_FULL_44_64]|uniref:Small ribosomal subunit protein uS7 n=1 Tax=Candidatus Blackburnbacteria bacterium RIFCSPHIGHO2_02_FULL_44_20 TaxID=1797516 RepID=A0A1G1VAJ9_9BACT|nr:MAG: 30S ribosomal protein S7 [Candidatus Blackburnbacteria bacterium RIFCSPHIGHO2_01_FULL_44_64]OGY11800.1 MAG: 30S ribosomal protein S7 [Candidatus Blackburnbacteria bacterium RIFCSPHIGHO2_12_FULL_44_25]OGY12287.1 MAG: 30S ribosomal protein S7 [Candidatus Blackburnbacteria bacterium RIFCSPHIGHO2_02_FULL_44_20]OGY14455.1 MAG: 30S ribosomal protein S7 [Candidatus Blackburnbacteria bacterium RIFCSPLOWO2_01_FULL_44_43]
MRRAKNYKRNIQPDPIYGHELVTKLINRAMFDGKRSVAQRQVYKAFEEIAEKTNEDALRTFLKAIDNIKPSMEVRPRRIGGAAYQVPAPVRGPRKESLAIRWLIQTANSRPNAQYKLFSAKLAAEIMDASKGEGGAIAKKLDIERQAEANRAFAHFNW